MNDNVAIIQCVLDYVEGWYHADADRMDLALSPHLAKRRIVSESEIWGVTKDEMITLTREGRGHLDDPEHGRKDITILAQAGTMASVKLASEKFIDYLHLVKIADTWFIVNALWDYITESQ